MWAAVLCLVGGLVPAHAQVFEAGIHVGQANQKNADLGTFPAGSDLAGTNLSLDDGFRFGFRITLNNFRFFGNEFGYAYNRANLLVNQLGRESNSGNAAHQGFYNFLGYVTPEGSRIRPFGAAGVHFTTYPTPGFSITQGGGSNKFGFNYGGGIKVRITDLFNIRLDYREYVNGKPRFSQDLNPNGRLRLQEISAGFGIALR